MTVKIQIFNFQATKVWQYINFNDATAATMSGQFVPDLPDIVNHSLLHNTNSQNKASSNVKVVCRIKPINENESAIDMSIDKQFAEISIAQPRQQTTKTFTFNRIYTNQSQREFVSEICDPILKRALYNKQGYLIFSYGVTNSGKTHTILGNQNEPGILPYLVKKLNQKTDVYLSAIELYNDQFFSLVNKEKLQPRQLGGFLDFNQCDIMEPITTVNMESKFKQFINNRTQNQTKLNAKSSRSHAIFRIKAGDVVIGVVDLAGSERTNRVFASIDQTSNINKSLLCLGRCIKALNENPQSHLPIPYRQSKLTKVLIEYFAAKSQVLMIANINQSQSCFHENMKVLDYAVLAKDIRHCSTESSLKKSQFKFTKTCKVDVFQSLYKSASKSAFAHKSLKSSRSKINDKQLKSVKAVQTNKKIARALKAQQLQQNIQKFASSQETFEYMIEYMHQRQFEDDKRRLLLIKNSKYESPVVHNYYRQPQQIKEVTEVGVGRSEHSMEFMKKELCEQMKEQLRKVLEEQRLANMKHQETAIGQSLSKNYPKQIIYSNSNDQEVQNTPMKGKNQSSADGNFIIKTSIAIYSSAKKVFSEKVHSIKNIWPSFKKASKKTPNLTFCNYNSEYEELFKWTKQPKNRESQFSNISFDGKISKSKSKKFVTIDFETQTSEQQFEKEQASKQTQETTLETDDEVSEYPHLPKVHFKDEQSVVLNVNEDVEKQNMEINEASDEETVSQRKEKQQPEHKQSKPTKKWAQKRVISKSKNKSAAERVAQMRKFAAKICRQNSRTPLKKRLRNHRKD